MLQPRSGIRDLTSVALPLVGADTVAPPSVMIEALPRDGNSVVRH
ncbi:hypothetical protein [Actinoallomurus oryzae]